jgi:hypothetical protein
MITVEIQTIKGKSQIIVRMPVLDVDSTVQGWALLAFTCTMVDGQFIVRELEQEQTVENLAKFGQRLADAYAVMKRKPRRKRK